MTSKHTPGPWRAHSLNRKELPAIIDLPDGGMVRVNGLNKAANATLIAAAPELLAFAKLAITEPGACCFGRSPTDTSADIIRKLTRRLEHITDQARAAIAEAEGKA